MRSVFRDNVWGARDVRSDRIGLGAGDGVTAERSAGRCLGRHAPDRHPTIRIPWWHKLGVDRAAHLDRGTDSVTSRGGKCGSCDALMLPPAVAPLRIGVLLDRPDPPRWMRKAVDAVLANPENGNAAFATLAPDTVVPSVIFGHGHVEASRRRMLLVSYSFPPDSSIGALRWEKLVAYGASRGWSTDVLTMDPSDASMPDHSRLATLPEATRVFAVPLRPHPYLTLERFVRGRLSGGRGNTLERFVRRRLSGGRDNGSKAAGRDAGTFPQKPDDSDKSLAGRLRALRRGQLAWLYYDEWRSWCSRAHRAGLAIGHASPYAIVISSGPPQMAHEAGRRISRDLGVPHAIDFRDMWHAPTAEPWDLVSPTWRKLSERYERACVNDSRLVVANTSAMEAILRARYPHLGDRLLTVMNGADPDVVSATPLATRFTLIYAGELYNGRDPRSLLQGLRAAIDAVQATPDQLSLRFLGAEDYEGVPLRQLAADADVDAFVRVEAKVPRSAAIQALSESAVLVILPQNQVECIPAKVFEYVQMSSWVLAITEPATATEMLLRGSTAGVISPDNVGEIGRFISRRYEEFRRGVRPLPVNQDGRLDRSREADRLFDALDRVAVRA